MPRKVCSYRRRCVSSDRGPPWLAIHVGDGTDNDGDGLLDCKDPDCDDICNDQQDSPATNSPAQACYKDCDYPGCGVKGVLKSWCHKGKCYMGMLDTRCKLRDNGYRLEDGWWCNEGRRDTYCHAREYGSQCFDGLDNVRSLCIVIVSSSCRYRVVIV